METSGSSIAGADALACLDKWGTSCFVGIGTEVKFNVRELLSSQITIMTSLTMSILGQKECADFVVERGLDVTSFTNEWKLEDAAEAYREFNRTELRKGRFHFLTLDDRSATEHPARSQYFWGRASLRWWLAWLKTAKNAV